MLIKFKMEGGFASFLGLNRNTYIDTTQLSPQQAAQIATIVHSTCFFDQPTKIGIEANGSADYRSYTITIEDGECSHTVQMSDQVIRDDFKELVDILRSLSRSNSSGVS